MLVYESGIITKLWLCSQTPLLRNKIFIFLLHKQKFIVLRFRIVTIDISQRIYSSVNKQANSELRFVTAAAGVWVHWLTNVKTRSRFIYFIALNCNFLIVRLYERLQLCCFLHRPIQLLPELYETNAIQHKWNRRLIPLWSINTVYWQYLGFEPYPITVVREGSCCLCN